MLIQSGGRVPRAVELANRLKRSKYVVEAYAVFGRFDVVAFLEAEEVNELFRSVSESTKTEGIMNSSTLVEVQLDKAAKDYGRGPFSS
jgi:uncharacterized protein with GYD domain